MRAAFLHTDFLRCLDFYCVPSGFALCLQNIRLLFKGERGNRIIIIPPPGAAAAAASGAAAAAGHTAAAAGQKYRWATKKYKQKYTHLLLF